MNNGGPAFPEKKRINRAGYPTNEFEPVGGMSLRDYFAAKAMQAMLSNSDTVSASTNCAREAKKRPDMYIAEAAYEFADAMLKARSQ